MPVCSALQAAKSFLFLFHTWIYNGLYSLEFTILSFSWGWEGRGVAAVMEPVHLPIGGPSPSTVSALLLSLTEIKPVNLPIGVPSLSWSAALLLPSLPPSTHHYIIANYPQAPSVHQLLNTWCICVIAFFYHTLLKLLLLWYLYPLLNWPWLARRTA